MAAADLYVARWLRAMGHEAAFEAEIADAAIVERARRTGELVLTSDAPLLERRAFTGGELRGIFVPRHAPVDEQLLFTMKTLGLAVLSPRCMACAGALDVGADRGADHVACEVIATPGRDRGLVDQLRIEANDEDALYRGSFGHAAMVRARATAGARFSAIAMGYPQWPFAVNVLLTKAAERRA